MRLCNDVRLKLDFPSEAGITRGFSRWAHFLEPKSFQLGDFFHDPLDDSYNLQRKLRSYVDYDIWKNGYDDLPLSFNALNMNKATTQ